MTGTPSRFLSLSVDASTGVKSATAAAMTTTSAAGARAMTASCISWARLHPHDLDPRRRPADRAVVTRVDLGAPAAG